MEALLWGLLGWVILPLWLLAGVADYITHARSGIATTSGVHESALHLLQTMEIGVPVLAVLLLHVNALTLLVMLAGAGAHTVTAYRDVRYAATRRYISPFEQFVHNFLNLLPLMALAIVLVLHWPVVRGLFGLDAATPRDWRLHWRDPAFSAWTIATVLLASLVFGLVPGVIEFMRTLACRRTSAARAASQAVDAPIVR